MSTARKSDHLPQPTVALIRGDDRFDNVRHALNALSSEVDLSTVRSLLIKPNFVVPDRPLAGTDPEAVRAVLEFVRARYDGPVMIAEGSASADVWEAYDRYGFHDLARTYDAELANVNDDEGVEVTAWRWNMRPQVLRLSRRVVETDYRISVGPPKTHDTVIVTLSLKNMVMGSLLSGLGTTNSRNGHDQGSARWAAWMRKLNRRIGPYFERSSLFLGLRAGYFGLLMGAHSHKAAMHQGFGAMNLNLARLAPYVFPHLSVIDGFRGMEGEGPTQGQAVDWRIAVASTDWLAADAMLTHLMGYSLAEVGYLSYCAQLGMGEADYQRMNVIGNVSPNQVRRRFTPHPSYRWQRRWHVRHPVAHLRPAVGDS